MSLYVASLNSGSNGNCYYIGNSSEAILVDAGISCREIEKRMKRLGLSLQKLKAVFVSHEHTDHIRGIPTLATKYQLPVYVTSATLFGCRFTLDKNLPVVFSSDEIISIGSLEIKAFPKLHDACDPYSFIVKCNGVKVGVFTDIGAPCRDVTRHFKECHAAFLEANYDEVMLSSGTYPYHLKKRISGGMGHLSNRQALELFKTHRPAYMSHLLLSHLSRNNNCPELVQKLFDEHAHGVKMIVASRYEETQVYHVTGSTHHTVRHKTVSSPQLSFSFA